MINLGKLGGSGKNNREPPHLQVGGAIRIRGPQGFEPLRQLPAELHIGLHGGALHGIGDRIDARLQHGGLGLLPWN